jgi:hypothetical protein
MRLRPVVAATFRNVTAKLEVAAHRQAENGAISRLRFSWKTKP